MTVWPAASFHPSLEIFKIKFLKKIDLEKIFFVVQLYIMPKSDFMFLAHTISHSTDKEQIFPAAFQI